MITNKLIDDVISRWRHDGNQIMDSQKKYNEIAIEAAIANLEKMKEKETV